MIPYFFLTSVKVRIPGYLYWFYLFYLLISIPPPHSFICQFATFLLTSQYLTFHHALSSSYPLLTKPKTISYFLSPASFYEVFSLPLSFIAFPFHSRILQSYHLRIFIFAQFYGEHCLPFYSWILKLWPLFASFLLLCPTLIFPTF